VRSGREGRGEERRRGGERRGEGEKLGGRFTYR